MTVLVGLEDGLAPELFVSVSIKGSLVGAVFPFSCNVSSFRWRVGRRLSLPGFVRGVVWCVDMS